MITKFQLYESNIFDPYLNLATEKQLMDITQPGTCVLYLWQNQNTVVIGRNQNAWLECRTSHLEEESGKLGIDYVITCSYGVADRLKGETESLESVMQLADERMYQYKAKQKEVG